MFKKISAQSIFRKKAVLTWDHAKLHCSRPVMEFIGELHEPRRIMVKHVSNCLTSIMRIFQLIDNTN